MAITLGEAERGPSHLGLRLTTLVVSVVVSLAAGTPYLYGVYSPQLVRHVGLTASDSATISLATNMGTGFGGLPAGMIIDHFGPRWSILLGSLCIFIGYISIYHIYQDVIGILLLICIAMVSIGFGSIISFYATLKACQSNFPKHKGAAGAGPISAYGLAATVFSAVSATFYVHDTAGFLKFLAIVCGAVTFFGSWAVGIYLDHDEDEIEFAIDEETIVEGDNEPSEATESVTQSLLECDAQSTPMVRDNDDESLRGSFSFWGIGTRTPRASVTSLIAAAPPILPPSKPQAQGGRRETGDYTPSLNTQFMADATETETQQTKAMITEIRTPVVTKKTNLKQVILNRLTDKAFLLHFVVVSLASGIGQMYIYSVGFVVTAQYNRGQDPAYSNLKETKEAASHLQALQVAVISIGSFSGRVISGILSDFIYKKYHIQRLWIVVFTLLLLIAGEQILIHLNESYMITVSSAIVGSCYGLTFGTYPAVIADFFGTRTFTTTWGLICTGPMVVLFVLNKYFGHIYDLNTNNETGICYLGNECYKGAFEVACALAFCAFLVTLFIIRQHYLKRL
ncbi:uncharacterized protein KQ657_001086 [Scheffersomyces spartinae]|uniref:Nodulin-like domain-containing protein n=1 Tax=Scheffersomyces spartinae TaxID=45513 RepID=A0A9P7V847_9ASCO|nr:uncharacterized protein KQ657_001086 [Scheffersomyces spartinae]KAG7192976.1 hypothetical protein KQ657_001086 [Scheffersomyces spartinae]